MNCFNTFILISVTTLILNLFTTVARGESVSSNILERARTVVEVAASSATETDVLRDVAIIAIRNASAVQLDVEELYLAAIKSGDKVKQVTARKRLDEVVESVAESRDRLQQVADLAWQTGVAAEAVKQQEKNVISARSNKDAERVLKHMQKTSEEAVKDAKKAVALAEILKKQWLLPLLPKVSVTPVVTPNDR